MQNFEFSWSTRTCALLATDEHDQSISGGDARLAINTNPNNVCDDVLWLNGIK